MGYNIVLTSRPCRHQSVSVWKRILFLYGYTVYRSFVNANPACLVNPIQFVRSYCICYTKASITTYSYKYNDNLTNTILYNHLTIYLTLFKKHLSVDNECKCQILTLIYQLTLVCSIFSSLSTFLPKQKVWRAVC